MLLISVKTFLVSSKGIQKSLEYVEINKDAIVMIKELYYPVEKDVVEDGKSIKRCVNELFYRVFLMNGESVVINEFDKHKIEEAGS